MFKKEGLIFGVLLFLSIGFVFGAAVENSLHLTIQTTNSTGVTTGTFDFVFNISDASDCSNVVYSDSATLTTDSRGIISYYLENVDLDFSTQYWLCYYRDGALINATKLARTPYSFSASNVSVGGLQVTSNFDLGSYNLTADSIDLSGNIYLNGAVLNTSNYLPTIVDSGNNSNGSYIKFIDGTMMAWGNVSGTTANAVSGMTGWYYTNAVTINFPVNFTTIPSIYYSIKPTGDVLTINAGIKSNSLTNSSAQVFFTAYSYGQSITGYWTAVGKWTNTPYDTSTITVGGGIPSGAIVPFNRTSCPVGWTLADGSNGTPDLRGIFIRGSGTNSVLKYANGSYFSAIQGSYANDSIQAHQHYFSIGGASAGSIVLAQVAAGTWSTITGTLIPTIPGFYYNDGAGTPRIGNETTPAYYSTIYCVKMTQDTADSNTIWETSGNSVLLANSSMNVNLTNNLSVQGTFSAPAQPIISGQVGNAGNVVGAQIIPFNEFWVSQGITYNSSTRRFTVPVDGIYRITLNPFFMTGYGGGRILIGVNTDTPTASTHYGHAYRESATHDTGCINSVVRLNASDYVVFYLAAGALYNQPTDRFNQFSIEKIA